MILQRDPRLNAKIHKYGCYFFSILFLSNKYTNCPISCASILDVYQIAIDGGWMDEDCYINDPEAIFDFMGLPVYFYDRHDPPYYNCGKDEIEILRFQYIKWKHFVVGDGASHIAFDPWGASKAVRLGSLRDKRIFKIQR